LKAVKSSDTVHRMPSPHAPGRRSRARRRKAHAAGRARRFAGLAFVAAAVLVTLLLTAFGSGTPARTTTTLAAAPAASLVPSSPIPQVVAQVGALRLDLPVSQQQLTALGYYGAGNGSLALEPLGRQGNRGRLGRLVDRVLGRGSDGLTWYRLRGAEAATSALAVGAAPGADVFSPVDGTIVGITDYVIDGRSYGVRVDIQPASAPSLVVSISRMKADPALTVGSAVVAATHRLGRVLDLSAVEQMSLADHTQDAGNHVTIEVRPAATLSLN
jgi:hypothetical protein